MGYGKFAPLDAAQGAFWFFSALFTPSYDIMSERRMKDRSEARNVREFFQKLKTYAPLSLKGWLVYLISMLLASLLCIMLQQVSTSDVHVPIIFVLVVLVVSLLTEGYFYGILAALTSVIAVNYAFTSPYMQIDFSPYGYPLTFMTLLAVGVAVSTLMTRDQQREKLRLETEREKLRANLLRGMSHDLRTPLTGISGSISAVLDNAEYLSPDQQRELLEGAKEHADWLCRMVENLLSVTRIGEDQPGSLHTQEEALEEVIGAAVLSFRKRNPDIAVEVSVPDTVLMVPMDPVLIQQVLQNLLDNAVIHGKTTGRIRVEATAEGNTARVSVKDDGVGISPDRLEHLFDGTLPFSGTQQSFDQTRSLGIGLSVCRTVIQAHGGSISAGNRPEGGACFSFTLPLGGKQVENP